MDYKLNNGLVIKINGEGEKIKNTYVEIEASGYHGDMDYEVNKSAKMYFNNYASDFQELIAFYSYLRGAEFDKLKEEYQKLFDNAGEFESLRDGWRNFLTDYSEVHDRTIDLDCQVDYTIDGVKYNDYDIDLDIFVDEE